MICESCESNIPDDAVVCPVCGVSTALFSAKPNPKIVTQTVPDFVKKPGSGAAVKKPAQFETSVQPVPETEGTPSVAASETIAETSSETKSSLTKAESTETDQEIKEVLTDPAKPGKAENAGNDVMICESCESTIPGDAAVCPVCGVSTTLFLTRSNPKLVTQTVPDFVKKPGSKPSVKKPAKADISKQAAEVTAAVTTAAETVPAEATVNTSVQTETVEPDKKAEESQPDPAKPDKQGTAFDNVTICGACGSSYDDNLAACPVCGVSKDLFLAKPNIKLVTQTVPDFVKKPGVELEVNSKPSSGSNTVPVSNENSAGIVPREKTNAATYAGLILGIITVVLSLIPYTYLFFMSTVKPLLFIPPVLGIILSIIGLLSKQGKSVPKAVAGIILSIIGIVVLLVGYYYFFLPGYTNFKKNLEDFVSHSKAMTPGGLMDTGYTFEEDSFLDFSYGDCETCSLHIDSYKIEL